MQMQMQKKWQKYSNSVDIELGAVASTNNENKQVQTSLDKFRQGQTSLGKIGQDWTSLQIYKDSNSVDIELGAVACFFKWLKKEKKCTL